MRDWYNKDVSKEYLLEAHKITTNMNIAWVCVYGDLQNITRQ